MLILWCVFICIFLFVGEYVFVLDEVVYMNNRRFLLFVYFLRKVSKKFLNVKVEKFFFLDILI